MDIIFYNTTTSSVTLEKELTDEHTLKGALRDSTDVVNPVIAVECDKFNYNYCYIPEFNRYYWVYSQVCSRKRLWVISLKCDVLMSYRDGIRELKGVVSRLNNGSKYGDMDIKVSCKKTHRVVQFEDKFKENGTYILITQGYHIEGSDG